MSAIVLQRFVWQSGARAHWAWPAGALQVYDIRGRAQQEVAGGVGGPCLTVHNVAPPNGPDTRVLGTDPLELLGAVRKTALETAIGTTLDAVRLGPAIRELLTHKADPNGTLRSVNLMPEATPQGARFRFQFGFLNADEQVDLDEPQAVNIRLVLREAYRKIRQAVIDGQAPPNLHRKVLGYWLRKFRTLNYRQFQPSDLPDEEPLAPATTITESFNKADADTLGPDLTWTELAGDIDVVSNQARSTTVDASVIARADSDLSSSDTYAQAAVDASDSTLAYPAVITRKDSSTTQDMYMAEAGFTDDFIRCYKIVAGTPTAIGSNVAHDFTVGVPATIKIQANGSTIKAFVDNVEKISVTDTAITTGLRAGLDGYKGTSGYNSWESFEAGDIAVSAQPPRSMHQFRMRA